MTDEFYPKPDDSIETLQQKRDLNINAAWGEIAIDLALPNRESDVTEYISNASVAGEYIEQKQKKGSDCNKCTIDDIEDDGNEKEENRPEKEKGEGKPCCGTAEELSSWGQLAQFATLGGALYVALKIIEAPILLNNPITAPFYFTH